jgi:hypothetical protein
MDSKTISGIKQQIFRQFPEVSGDEPSVKAQAGAKTPGSLPTYLITFKGRVSQPSGAIFNRTVRVVANEAGQILKVTTSR